MSDNEKNGDSLYSQMARLEIQMTSLAEKVEDIKINVTQIAKLYEIVGDVEAGTRPMPAGYEDIELARLRQEVERLKRKVEELTGERGNNPAVRKSDLATPV